jgi:hypothetical protein
MNSLIYDFQSCAIRKGDQTLEANIKPEFSFAYDALAYNSISMAKYQHENTEHDLTAEQVDEVEAYITSVAPDPVAQTNMESLMYLADTDWYVVREFETGVEVPTEVLTKRAAARLAIA